MAELNNGRPQKLSQRSAVARRREQRKIVVGPAPDKHHTLQAHPCNAATAAAAGFKVITLMIEENGIASTEALKAAVSDRTAALLVNNPDDMGIYNPDIKDWVRIVHRAGGLCFYDHANFNGVMGKLRARELGFDACMYMLHKTFGAPKGGGGPAVGAYGCSGKLVPFLPGPIVTFDGTQYRLDGDRPQSAGKVGEFWGNVPQIVKAYGWARRMGADGIREAADLSVLANNYMEKRLLAIRGVGKSYPHLDKMRMEMTRYSLGQMKEETGESRAVARPRALHSGGRRNVLERGYRYLDRGARPDLGRGLLQSGDREDSTTQSGHSQDQSRRAGRPGHLGDDLASISEEEGREGLKMIADDVLMGLLRVDPKRAEVFNEQLFVGRDRQGSERRGLTSISAKLIKKAKRARSCTIPRR